MKTTINLNHFRLFVYSFRSIHKKIKRIDKTKEADSPKTYNLSFKAIFSDISSKNQKTPVKAKEINMNNFGKDIFAYDKDVLAQANYVVDEKKRVQERKRKNIMTMSFMDEVFYHTRRHEMELYNSEYYGKTNVEPSYTYDCEEKIYDERMDLMLAPLKRSYEMDAIKDYEKNDPQSFIDVHRNMINNKDCGILVENDRCLNYDSEDEIDRLMDNLKSYEKEMNDIDERFSKLIIDPDISFEDEHHFNQYRDIPLKDLTGVEMPGENEAIDKSYFKMKSNDVKYQRVWRKRIEKATDQDPTNEV
jgi:hypothetical protein